MFVKVQDAYRSTVLQSIHSLETDGSFFDLTVNSNQIPQLIVGDIDFLESASVSEAKCSHVLVLTEAAVSPAQLEKVSRKGDLRIVNELRPSELTEILRRVRSTVEKEAQVSIVKAEIQRKRKELEELNRKLTSESQQKIEFLEKSHIEETEKNLNEKSLLHFLDFIQSESISDDFPEKLFRFIWKDLKRFGRVYTLGLSHTGFSGKSKISFYDGIAESTSIASVDFTSGALSTQLATIWGRPVGKTLNWRLPETSRPTFLFVEVVDQQMDLEKTSNYFAERLAVLSMYLDRWMIEKEIEVVVERWKNTFRSFSGFTHVVDEHFEIYHANYAHNSSGGKCYRVLAGRESPCDECPVLKSKNTSFHLKKDLSVKTNFSQFKYQEKKYFFVIYEDVTKINLLHSQIIQTEKMSTLGRIGNHLAHELNNPLTGIKSYVQTVLDDEVTLQTLPGTAKSDLSEILKAAVRCQKIIKNFIEFSQKKEPVLEKVSFQEVVNNTIVLLKTALRSHRLFVDLKDDFVMANAHDLQQVLFNLIKNACQAMAQPGVIKIYQEKTADKIIFYVEDSGPGFSDNIMKNIFQPFMTTKAQGEGTGLGLYLSKKLINNMHAEMDVTSSPKGAKIALIFDQL